MATAASRSNQLFLPLLLSHAYKDKDGQEAAIRASSLDWVIVRPAMFTNDPARGSVRAVTDLAGVNGVVLSSLPGQCVGWPMRLQIAAC